MNLFVIPSWYPHRFGPASGIFFQEQALAIGSLRPTWNIAISLWGQQEHHVALSRLSQWPKRLANHMKNAHPTETTLRENVVEYKHPILTWNRRIGGGNIAGVLRANEKNFQWALQILGSLDMLHAHVSYPAGWIAMKLSEKYSIPYVITEHMSPFPFPEFLLSNGRLSPEMEQALQRANKVIAVSPSLASRIESFGINNVCVVPNLVDESFFSPILNKKQAVFSFFTLGNMVQQKGIPVLLSAIASWLSRSPDMKQLVRFRIGGNGAELADYQALAQKLAVSDVVDWLGGLTREQAGQEFQNCDCFVLPSLHETFGVVLAEAAACGKPIIATKCGGPEYIVNKENGLLVPPSNPGELAAALQHMVLATKKYSPEKIREDFLARFSRKTVVDKLESLYERVLRDSAK